MQPMVGGTEREPVIGKQESLQRDLSSRGSRCETVGYSFTLHRGRQRPYDRGLERAIHHTLRFYFQS
ncbi:hypothetical protein NKDENANG_01833 [Candidatus Entotheonellaceae bacterium PAL068K]